MNFQSQDVPGRPDKDIQIWLRSSMTIPKDEDPEDTVRQVQEGELQLSDYDLVRVTDKEGNTLAEAVT